MYTFMNDQDFDILPLPVLKILRGLLQGPSSGCRKGTYIDIETSIKIH